MSEFSRVKKNKKLYSEIIEDDKTKIIESSLRDYERRTTDSHSDESKYQASRYRKNHDIQKKESSVAAEPVESVVAKEAIAQKEILRDRDLLEEFIEEVKHYNINRGLRNVQDTQMNILQNLGKTSQDAEVEKIKEEPKQEVVDKSDQDLTQEIMAIISNLDNEDIDYEEDEKNDFVFTPLDDENDKKLSTIFDEIEEHSDKPKIDKKSFTTKNDANNESEESIEEETEDAKALKTDNVLALPKTQDLDGKLNKFEPSVKETTSYKDGRDFKSQELLELTQTLNLKLDLHENEIQDVSKKVTILDKILSLLIVFLIIAWVVIILFGIYWVSKERGLF